MSWSLFVSVLQLKLWSSPDVGWEGCVCNRFPTPVFRSLLEKVISAAKSHNVLWCPITWRSFLTIRVFCSFFSCLCFPLTNTVVPLRAFETKEKLYKAEKPPPSTKLKDYVLGWINFHFQPYASCIKILCLQDVCMCVCVCACACVCVCVQTTN